jgi:hypothetical protein
VSNAENQPIGHGPKGWLEKGPSRSLFVRYVSQRISSSLTPRIRTLLKPTVCLLLMTRCTSRGITISLEQKIIQQKKAESAKSFYSLAVFRVPGVPARIISPQQHLQTTFALGHPAAGPGLCLLCLLLFQSNLVFGPRPADFAA